MHMLKSVVLIAFGCVLLCGCEEGKPAKNDSAKSNGGHSHSHGDGGHSHEGAHTHDQETDVKDDIHGVNGGHKFVLEPAEFIGEWLVSDDNTVKIFLLDKDGKANSPARVDHFELRRGDIVFTLDPDGEDSEGKTAVYSLDDQDLSMAINLGVDVKIMIGDQTYTGKISPVEPHDH